MVIKQQNGVAPQVSIVNSRGEFVDFNGIGNGNNNNNGNNLTWSTPTSDTVTTTAKDIVPADANRLGMRICNLSAVEAEKMYININQDASPTAAIFVIQREQTLLLDSESAGRISAYAASGTINYTFITGS